MGIQMPMRVMSCLLAALLVAESALGAGAEPPVAPPPPATAAELLNEQLTALDTDLAAALQRRPEVSGQELAISDFEIDLKVVQRWILDGALAEKEARVYSAAALRLLCLRGVAARIDKSLRNSSHALSPSQLAGLKALHDYTYKLPSFGGTAGMDQVCRAMVDPLVLVSEATAAEVKQLPTMRPPAPAPATRPAPARRALADLVQRAAAVQVSPALRRELVALATQASDAAAGAASTPATDANNAGADAAKNAAQLYQALLASIDMADGLERNVGVTAASHAALEQQLSDALALYLDPRTRSGGRQRLGALSDYHAMLLRVQSLHLPGPLLRKLAPALVWANENPQSAGDLLRNIEQYLLLGSRFDGAVDPPGATPGGKKTVDFLRRQFTVERTAFIDEAATLGSGGFSSATPASLAPHVAQMQQDLQRLELVQRLPHALQTLAVYRPRPAGAIDRRSALAVADLGSVALTSAHQASARVLADIEQLADAAEGTALPQTLPPSTVRTYLTSRQPAIETRRIALVSSLASELAAGKEMESAEMGKLALLRQMMQSLPVAAEVDADLARAEALSGWVDWSVSAGELRNLYQPYREATTAAFEGFADDNLTPMYQWPQVSARLEPVITLIRVVSGYDDACASLPRGLPGEFAKLLTPLDAQPFQVERDASLSIALWERGAQAADTASADANFDRLRTNLFHDLHPQ